MYSFCVYWMFILIEGTVPSKTSRTHEITLDGESLALPLKFAGKLIPSTEAIRVGPSCLISMDDIF